MREHPVLPADRRRKTSCRQAPELDGGIGKQFRSLYSWGLQGVLQEVLQMAL